MAIPRYTSSTSFRLHFKNDSTGYIRVISYLFRIRNAVRGLWILFVNCASSRPWIDYNPRGLMNTARELNCYHIKQILLLEIENSVLHSASKSVSVKTSYLRTILHICQQHGRDYILSPVIPVLETIWTGFSIFVS